MLKAWSLESIDITSQMRQGKESGYLIPLRGASG
tara:strand:- start:265 stop:366 length:102 start_codon:yes stop_codon:yes gene_type:complete